MINNSTPYIPKRFASVAHVHLARNLQRDPHHSVPLLIGIHGRSGDGKTFQLRHVLDQAGVRSVLLSGGQLESSEAGEPGARIRDAYLEAGTAISNGIPAAVVLNDADAAIGNWGELTQYTVNTQIIITELMHLCDYPNRVEGKSTPRVPIFLTGNDFTRLYEPLRRHGRMELFRWEMTPEERAIILADVFTGLTSPELKKILSLYPEYSIADWTAVAAKLLDGRLAAYLASTDVKTLLPSLVRGARLEGRDRAASFDEIIRAIKYLSENDAANLVSRDS